MVIGGFSSMENAELRRCVKFDNPTWSLSETGLKGIKTRGMADGWWKHQEKHKLLMALICLRIVLILSGTLYQS